MWEGKGESRGAEVLGTTLRAFMLLSVLLVGSSDKWVSCCYSDVCERGFFSCQPGVLRERGRVFCASITATFDPVHALSGVVCLLLNSLALLHSGRRACPITRQRGSTRRRRLPPQDPRFKLRSGAAHRRASTGSRSDRAARAPGPFDAIRVSGRES